MILTLELLAERITHLREICDERKKHSETSLQLQATEYYRRLDNLNHEHERIAKSQSEHVSRQLFDQVVGELHKDLASAASFRKAITVACVVVSTILALAIAYYHR